MLSFPTVSKRKFQAQTFDPFDLDVHGVEHSIRSKIWPLQKREKLANVYRDLEFFKGQTKEMEKPKKSVLVSIFANILLPGLGNMYIKPNAFSIAILASSLLVMLTTLSPLFPIVNILNLSKAGQPTVHENSIPALYLPSSILVENQVLIGPTFSILVVPLLLAWLHLLYLLLGSKEWKWRV